MAYNTSVLGDKLNQALSQMNNYVWKGKKNGDNGQEEIKLMEATPEQLQQFYEHCDSMLYNEDNDNPGRYVLLDIIDIQIKKCLTELFLRYIENPPKELNRERCPRFTYLMALKSQLKGHPEITQDKYNQILLQDITSGMPLEFYNLTLDMVMDGCLDTLGVLSKKHITLSFITKLGLWFTQEELKEFDERDINGKLLSRTDQVRERLNLRPTVELRIKDTGLSFKEFRAMVNLKDKKYSELSTDQLNVLAKKLLFRLQKEVKFHAMQWETRISQIEEVAKARNITLTLK